MIKQSQPKVHIWGGALDCSAVMENKSLIQVIEGNMYLRATRVQLNYQLIKAALNLSMLTCSQ